MIFENISTFPIILSLLLIVTVIYFFGVYIKNNKNILSLIFLSISLIFLIISLFSPRYGSYNQTVKQNGGNILFIMDVSKSMKVFDIGYGENVVSRLQAVKYTINNYIESNIGNNYSLFAFAGETLELLPLTNDSGLFQTILNGIDQNNISTYGSDFESLFQIISNYVELEENAGTIVIFTDGGEIDNLLIPDSLIKKIDKHNSQVVIIGIGTNKGGYIIEGMDLLGRPVYKIYDGEKVLSKINTSGIIKITNKYNFQSGFLDSNKQFDNIEVIINSLILKQYYEKEISLAHDISYIFTIFFFIFFSLFLFIENKKTK